MRRRSRNKNKKNNGNGKVLVCDAHNCNTGTKSVSCIYLCYPEHFFLPLFLKVKFKCYKKLLNSFRFLWICFLMHVIYFKCFSCYSYCAFPCYLLSKVFHDIDWVNRREVGNLVTHALLCRILHHFYENEGLLLVLKVPDNSNYSVFVKRSWSEKLVFVLLRKVRKMGEVGRAWDPCK